MDAAPRGRFPGTPLAHSWRGGTPRVPEGQRQLPEEEQGARAGHGEGVPHAQGGVGAQAVEGGQHQRRHPCIRGDRLQRLLRVLHVEDGAARRRRRAACRQTTPQ